MAGQPSPDRLTNRVHGDSVGPEEVLPHALETRAPEAPEDGFSPSRVILQHDRAANRETTPRNAHGRLVELRLRGKASESEAKPSQRHIGELRIDADREHTLAALYPPLDTGKIRRQNLG
jgi:hypothetical protein